MTTKLYGLHHVVMVGVCVVCPQLAQLFTDTNHKDYQ